MGAEEQGLSCAGSSRWRNGLILPRETPRVSLSVSTYTMGDFPKYKSGPFILAHALADKFPPSSYSLLQFSSHCVYACLCKCAKMFLLPSSILTIVFKKTQLRRPKAIMHVLWAVCLFWRCNYHNLG